MREMRGEVGKKSPKKEMGYPSFLLRLMADFLGHFDQLLIFAHNTIKDYYLN